MALVATRRFSLGEQVLAEGDMLDPAVLADLPRGRIETLKRAGLVREDQAPESEMASILPLIAEELTELRERIEKLEAAKRRPGRPRKEDA